MLDKVKHHIKFQDVNDRLLSIDSFCLSESINVDDLKNNHKQAYDYLKMASRHHLLEKSLKKVYSPQVAIAILEIDDLTQQIEELSNEFN